MQTQQIQATPLLEVREVTKSYPVKGVRRGSHSRVKALDKVSFRLGPGLYGLLGPNGAGKSTLMNIITCNLMQDSGSVFWNGKNIHHRQERFFFGARIYAAAAGTLSRLYRTALFGVFAALKEIPQREISVEAERGRSGGEPLTGAGQADLCLFRRDEAAAARRAGADRQPAAADSGRADRGAGPQGTGAAAGG